jgi:hypothetical protein
MVSETDSMKGKRPWRGKVLALLLSLFAGLVVAEIAVRVLVGSPLSERLPIMEMQSNPHRGWQMVPGKDHYTYHHLVRVNEHGFRGPPIEPPREDRIRVLALGDSLVYGQGVGDGDTIPVYLEAALGESDPQARAWEVINSGHRAYDTRQELALIEELGEELQPDVVVVFWFWNDIFERDIEDTCRRLKEIEPVAFDTGNRVEGAAWWKWQGLQFLRRSALVMLLHDTAVEMGTDPLPGNLLPNALFRLDGYARRFEELAASMGFRLVFALIPDPNALLGPHPSCEVSAQVTEVLRTHGIEPVDLLPAVREVFERDRALPVIPFDGHYLPEANRAMGQRLAERLIE